MLFCVVRNYEIPQEYFWFSVKLFIGRAFWFCAKEFTRVSPKCFARDCLLENVHEFNKIGLILKYSDRDSLRVWLIIEANINWLIDRGLNARASHRLLSKIDIAGRKKKYPLGSKTVFHLMKIFIVRLSREFFLWFELLNDQENHSRANWVRRDMNPMSWAEKEIPSWACSNLNRLCRSSYSWRVSRFPSGCLRSNLIKNCPKIQN